MNSPAHNRQRTTLYSYVQKTGGIEVERQNTSPLAHDLGLRPADLQTEITRLGKVRASGRRLRILGPKPRTGLPAWPLRTLRDGLRLIVGGHHGRV